MTATGGFEQCEGIAMLDVVWFVVECRGVNREALHRLPGFPPHSAGGPCWARQLGLIDTVPPPRERYPTLLAYIRLGRWPHATATHSPQTPQSPPTFVAFPSHKLAHVTTGHGWPANNSIAQIIEPPSSSAAARTPLSADPPQRGDHGRRRRENGQPPVPGRVGRDVLRADGRRSREH